MNGMESLEHYTLLPDPPQFDPEAESQFAKDSDDDVWEIVKLKAGLFIKIWDRVSCGSITMFELKREFTPTTRPDNWPDWNH